MKRLVLVFFLIYSLGEGLYSQEREIVTIKAGIRPQSINRGGRGVLVIVCEIQSEYHITDTTGGLFKVVPEQVEGVIFEEAEFPKAEKRSFGNIYLGRVEVKVPITVRREAKEGKRVIATHVMVQPCGDRDLVCYPPESRKVETEFSILPDLEKVQTTPEEPVGISNRLTRALEQKSIIAFFLVFLGGILTSFTPCVYPMIPITIAVIGAQATGRKLRGFVLSLFYVLGVAVTFSVLGMIAARSGALFGSYAQHPVVVVFISAVFFLMGLSLLGAFVLQMPPLLASKLRGRKRRGFLGAMVTGLLAGLVVSPCISPLLVVILTWVAKTGSMVLGFGLLFSFALGLGVLFVLIGTFSGVLKNLPKSGGWMELIERGFGILLVTLSIMFLRPIVSLLVYQGLWAVFLVFIGTFAGAFTPLDREADWRRKVVKALGVFAVLVSGCLIFFGFVQRLGVGGVSLQSVGVQKPSTEEQIWISSDQDGFMQARLVGKPVLMDFFAEWCAACHELDEKTWSDHEVRAELDKFIRIKIDLTKIDKQRKMLQKKYNVVGMPTVIIFDSIGTEMYRFEGFKRPKEVLEILRQYDKRYEVSAIL